MGREQVRRARLVVEDETLALVCNKCGRRHELGSHDGENNIHLFTAGGGYGTKFPGDLEQVEFGLCSWCLKELVDSFFVLAPVTGGFGVQPYEAHHTEHELAVWIIDCGWAYPKGECPWDEYTRETSGEYLPLSREREGLLQDLEALDHPWPSAPLYRHFKSLGGEDHLYEIVDRHIYDARTHEPLVVYRALYDDSTIYVRPLSMWGERVTRDVTPTGPYDGPRFRPLVDIEG